jgi:outer membrane protein insertion porin family
MKRIPLLLILLLALVGAGSAQTHRARKPAASPTPAPATVSEDAPWPLETLTVEGNRNYTAEQILAVARLRVGEKAGKPEFEAARQRLAATGAFDNVGYRFAPAKDGKGYDGVIQITELNGALYPLRFEDLPATDAQLRAWLKQKDPLFGDKIPATKPELDRYVQLISAYLAEQGYHYSVAGKVTSEGASGLVVVFRPAKARPAIARVKFTNTGEIPAGLLQTAMYGVAVGTLYTEPDLRVLLDTTARPRYEARGMIRVAFPKIETQPAKDVDGIDVTVQVEPGPVYKLGRVSFQGASYSQQELAKLANLKANVTANFDDVKAAQERIAQNLRRSGYLQTSSQVKRDVNDAEHVVDLTFDIAPGPQFTLGKLDVVGLDIETEPVIRKMWGIQPGKPFNIEYPEHFLSVVKNQGIFDNLKNTRAETKVNANEHTVDVTLYFNK